MLGHMDHDPGGMILLGLKGNNSNPATGHAL